MVGCFATSKAGHDKTQIYVILREDAEYIYLADGKCKTVTNPKKKNRKHIQPIRQQVEKDLLLKIINQTIKDEEISRAIVEYSKKK